MSELVTGEAVALELRPAKLPSRALAVLIDLVVAFAVYIAVTIVIVAATSSLDDAAAAAVAVATFLLVLVGIPIAVETLSHGRSLGKLACGLRVVRDDGGPIRFRHALVRGAVGVVEILMTFGVVACIASLVSARGRRIGDVVAGTLVVRERVPAGQASFVPPPPPWLVGRFAQLDLSGVPEGLWLAMRQYLTRMGQLDPQVGWSMAERLAADLAAHTGAPVPSEVPPAAFLAAVMHERQSREAQRAFGAARPGGPTMPGGPTPLPGYAPAAHAPYAPPAAPVPPMAPTPGAYVPPSAPSSTPGDGRSEPPTTGFVPPA
ncbi:RDD family protein [Streptomyces sp. VRA16 Mangrove soil]|uniref:RDD family protein n=1 Tax=Streptomyces sp. VRA16 Mangrove soil TaxID=2817434 RepID=UPI001A9D9C82|nr:RDD family protein [Streptomyces sp. VRA16 Mangrove soil]MBO1338074.1 RDD family protein [Streptomyces sp. VRA16 Mangrove soil]